MQFTALRVDIPGYYSERKEATRQAVNKWIRTSHAFVLADSCPASRRRIIFIQTMPAIKRWPTRPTSLSSNSTSPGAILNSPSLRGASGRVAPASSPIRTLLYFRGYFRICGQPTVTLSRLQKRKKGTTCRLSGAERPSPRACTCALLRGGALQIQRQDLPLVIGTR
jgi:hypothetical protein